jgi:hypothetical protein
MSALRLVLLFVVMLALTGCPGPNYAPYNNMRNSYGSNTSGTGAL